MDNVPENKTHVIVVASLLIHFRSDALFTGLQNQTHSLKTFEQSQNIILLTSTKQTKGFHLETP